MSDHEQPQQNDQGSQAGDEPKESWGSNPESHFDSDGFVRSPDEVLNARAGKLASDVVMDRLPDTRDFRLLKKEVEDGPREREDALMRGATARDMMRSPYAHEVSDQFNAAGHAIDLVRSPENVARYNEIKRQYDWQQDRKLSESEGDEELYLAKKWRRKEAWDYYDSQVALVATPVHDLLDLNKEKLANLTVAEFVVLVDEQSGLLNGIDIANNLGPRYERLSSDIEYAIKDRSLTYPGQDEGKYFEVTGPLGSFLRREPAPDADAAKRLGELRDKVYDISPGAFLTECLEIAKEGASRMEQALTAFQNSLEAFDERIRSGNFSPEPPVESQQDANGGEQLQAAA